MNLNIKDYSPYVYLLSRNEFFPNFKIKCLIDTGFTGTIACPYFSENTESLINKIDLKKKCKLLDKKDWIESATDIIKTYQSSLNLNFLGINFESDILIYQSNLKYSKKNDYFILGMKFIRQNNLKLIIQAKNSKFFESKLSHNL